MRNGICADLLRITGYGHTLEYSLGRYRNRVSAVAKDVSVNHVAQALVIVLPGHIQSHIRLGAKLVRILFIGLQLFRAESSGVGASRINLIAFLLCKVHHRVGGVKTAAERDHNFLLIHNIRFVIR